MEKEQNRESDEVSVDINKLSQSLRSLTETLETLSDKCCIYRVLPSSRVLNEKAYTPKVVSIGPFHHGKKEYAVMEEHKRRYLVDFLRRCGLSIEEYTKKIHKLEMPMRNSYAELTHLSREEFMQIMAVDGTFLLENFLKRHFKDWSSNDRIWHRQRLAEDVSTDILMIENQLPFFLLEALFELFEKSNPNGEVSLMKVVVNVIVGTIGWGCLNTDNITDCQVENLVDFIGICLQPSSDSGVRRQCDNLSTPTISELHQAGVKFKPVSSKSLYDLKFNNGIFEIPILRLMDRTDIVVFNMQAYENYHRSYNHTNNYTCIMNSLINNEEDVELLVRSGCIENWLQDNNTVVATINGFSKSGLVQADNFIMPVLFKISMPTARSRDISGRRR